MGLAESGDRTDFVRRLYEETDFTVNDIARFAGMSASTIYYHVKRQGWVSNRRPGITRPKAVPPTPALRALAGQTQRPAPAPADRADIARRLWAALERHLDELKPGDADQTALPTAQNLATLARTLEKLIEVERDMAREEGGDGAGGDQGDDDVGALLAELARRIEALA